MLKKIAALVLAGVMVIGSVVPAFADGAVQYNADGTVKTDTYTITVKNTKTDNVSLKGQNFTAWKLFDNTYVPSVTGEVDGQTVTHAPTVYAQDATPHAYTISKDSPFFAGATLGADGKYTGTEGTYAGEILKYFDFTEYAGDPDNVIVTIKKVLKDGSTTEYKDDSEVFGAEEAYKLTEAINKIGWPTDTDEKWHKTVGATGETVTIDVSELGAGYYFVMGSGQAYEEGDAAGSPSGKIVTAAIALTTTDPKAEINAKLDAQKLEKKIDEHVVPTGTEGDAREKALATNGKFENTDVKYDEHSVGETVPYILKTKLPNTTGYEEYFFYVTDTLSKGLTLNDTDAIADDTSTENVNERNDGSNNGFVVKLVKGDTEVPLTRVKDYAAAVAKETAETNPTKMTFYVQDVQGDGEDGANADGSKTFEIVFHDMLQYSGTLITQDMWDEEGNLRTADVTHIEDASGETITLEEGQELPEGAKIVYDVKMPRNADGTIPTLDKNMIGTYYNEFEGWDVVIMYSATLNEDAVVGDLGNPNTAKLTYSTNPDLDYNGKTTPGDYPTDEEKKSGVTQDTKESTTVTYTSGVIIFKYGTPLDPNEKQALADAVFTLTGTHIKNIIETKEEIYRAPIEDNDETAEYYRLKDGSYTKDVPKPDKITTTGEGDDAVTTVEHGTYDLYDQSEWPENWKTGATKQTYKGVEYITAFGADIPAEFVKAEVKSIDKASFVKDNTNGTYYLLKNGTYTNVAPTDSTKSEYVDDGNQKYRPLDTYTSKTAADADDDFTWDAARIYYQLADGSYTTEAPTNDTLDKYMNKTGDDKVTTAAAYIADSDLIYNKTYLDWEEMTAEQKAATSVTLTAKTDADGTLTFSGLGEGEYVLTETGAPEGYNPLQYPIHIVIEWTKPTGITTDTNVQPDAKTGWTAYSYSEDETVPTDADELAAFKNSEDHKMEAGVINGGLFKQNVLNATGIELPSTGGIGTTIFYAGGAILVLLAGVLLVSKRRFA